MKAGGGPRQQQVKNRSAADIQVTAEQLINEARTQFGDLNERRSHAERERQLLLTADKEELKDYLQVTRKKFEENVRKDRSRLRNYTEYARFEVQQQAFDRMRSIMERAASVMPHEPKLYVQYAEFEAKAGFANHALNIMHRAVGLLPRVDELWLKYLYYENMLGDEARTRGVFERWMTWEPKEEAWFAFAEFEVRHGHVDRARDVFERFCGAHATARAYIKYAKWEDHAGRIALARAVFERAAGARVDADGRPMPDELPEDERAQPDLWLAFGAFESRHGEIERARRVYLHALDVVHEAARGHVFTALAAFEKKLGGTGSEGVDAVITERRRREYESAVRKDPLDYDAWFDLARLEEASGAENVRATYARAEANVPPNDKDKRMWRRFVYLFIFAALYEELVAKDIGRARAQLRKGLDCVPHRTFTFAKLWIMAAHLELRAGDLAAARKLMGAAIGVQPKDKTFRAYLQMELQLGQVDRCRVLYEKYLHFNPANASAWAKFAELEAAVGEEARARAVFELGVGQATLDEPEKLWLRYIDFEAETKDAGAPERVCALYERLLERTGGHVRVWVAFAKYLAMHGDRVGEARAVLDRADAALKTRGEPATNEDLALLRKAIVELEEQLLATGAEGASAAAVERARGRLAQRVERRKAIPGRPDEETRFEDVIELVFPDLQPQGEDAQAQGALKLLQMAQQWKRARTQAAVS